MITEKRGRKRTPDLPLPHRQRGWKTGPKGRFGLRIHRSKRADGTETRQYALAVPRPLGDELVKRGFLDQQFTVEIVEDGILYRRIK